MNYRNTCRQDFDQKIHMFRGTWHDAYTFLNCLRDNGRGFWLSSDKNAHSYYQNSFIAHVTLKHSEIELSPDPHIRICNGTRDGSDILFLKIEDIITQHDGWWNWAERKDNKRKDNKRQWTYYIYILQKPAPQAFFDDLLKTIEAGKQALES